MKQNVQNSSINEFEHEANLHENEDNLSYQRAPWPSRYGEWKGELMKNFNGALYKKYLGSLWSTKLYTVKNPLHRLGFKSDCA